MPQTIKMIVQYDGSNYHGFQRQQNAHTVQAQIEQGIYQLSGEKAAVACAGRTDAGVHALGQVIAFNTESAIPPTRWSYALNSSLPDDIQIISSSQAENSFHPRYMAISKHYQYRIYQGDTGIPFCHRYAWCYKVQLNIGYMQEAAAFFIGRHDLKAFCASGTAVKTYERRIINCSLQAQDNWVTFDIEADGFLYNMVRIIMGTLVEVGRGRYSPKAVTNIIKSGQREKAGPTVPPQGLYLVKVNY